MAACKIRVVGSTGELFVPGVEPVPGPRVYERPEDLREEGDGVAKPWRLGHHSGLALAAFPPQDDALRGAREVADLTDWTRPAEELRADVDFDRAECIDRMEGRTNGLFIAAARQGSEL